MSWYDSDYRYRLPISVDNTASASATYSFSLTLPEDLDVLWDNAQTDGDDLILTLADGVTRVSVANATAIDIDDGAGGAFAGAARDGRIRLDKLTVGTANQTCFLWLYYGNAAATTSSDFGAWTSPTTVTPAIGREGSRRISPRVVTRPEDPTATVPRAVVAKTTNETIYVYWDFGGELIGRDAPYEGRVWYEEIRSAIVSAETGGVNAPTVVTATDTLLLGLRGAIVRTTHAAGSVDTDYVLKLKIVTSLGRTLERRCVMQVRNPVEPQ